jgi:hypothetical protein
MEEAYKMGIDLLTLPAHTTHRLQPLDVSVFGPFKSYFKSRESMLDGKEPKDKGKKV